MTSRTLPSLLLVLVAVLAGVLAAAPAGAGSMSLAWDPVADADLAGYRLEYGTAPGVYGQLQDVGNATSFTLNGLTDCTTWYVAIKAYDTAGNRSVSFSNEISGWPRPTAGSLTPAVGEQGLTLNVTLSGTNFRSGASVLFSNPGVTVNSVTVNGCNELVASITVGASAATGATSLDVVNTDQTFGTGAGLFTVQAATPPTVASTSPANGATGISTTVQPSITFSEAMSPASITSSTVQVINSGGTPLAQAAGSPALSPDGRTATITLASPLTLGQTYRLRAVGGASGVKDLAGNALASTFTQATGFSTQPDSVPPVISAVAAGSITGTSAQITWTTDEVADSQVFWRLAGQTAYQQTAIDTNLLTSHSMQLTGLMPSTTYEYHVRSADGAGNAAVSSPDRTFTTAASSSSYLVFEAEAGTLASPVRSVTGTNAFGGAYIDTPQGTSQGSANNPAGTAVFGVNIPTAGTWYLWVRMNNVTGSGGTWYESMDGGSRQLMNVSAINAWEWSAGRSYTLTAGLHSLELGGRRAEARADRILLTNDPAFVPSAQPVGDQTPPAAPTSFTATPSNQANALAWTNPSSSDLARIVIRVRTDGVTPVTPVDGTAVLDRAATASAPDSFLHTGLVNGTAYRYAIFAVDAVGNVSVKATATGTPQDNQPPANVQSLRRTDVVSP